MSALGAVTIEPGGLVFRGVAVPFEQSALVVEADGRIVAERFDEESVTTLPIGAPLLVSHRRDRPPAGVITGAGVGKFGIGIEGRLSGSDDEVEGWHRRFGDGLMASLSIGFTARGRQEYRLPEAPGAPPMVVRRGVSIVEVSLVVFPAYDGAGLTSVSVRTADADESARVMAEMTTFLADVRTTGRR